MVLSHYSVFNHDPDLRVYYVLTSFASHCSAVSRPQRDVCKGIVFHFLAASCRR